MRRFRFSLDPVLRLRGQLEEQAQLDLAASRRRLEQEQAALLETERQLHLYERLRAQLQQAPLSPSALCAADPYREELERAREDRRAAVREAEDTVARSLQTLRQRRVDREILDRLRERRHLEHQGVALREEQQSLDETAVLRFSRG
jgi:flagellar protein FliJ